MYDIFEKLLKEYNVTAYRVSKDTGIAYSSFADWKAGRSVPKADKLEKIADYFGVSVDRLMGRDEALKKSEFYNELRHELVMSTEESFKLFSKECRKQRISQELTEKYVADKADVTLEEYLDFESGKEIDYDKVLRILDVLNIDYAYLYGLIKAQSYYDTDDLAAILENTDIKESTKQIALYLNKVSPDILVKTMLETLSYEEINNYIKISENIKNLMDRR